MLVTLFTDAGACPFTRKATWAAWCKSERGVSRAGGILKNDGSNINIAEASAAVNGIYHALSSGVARKGDTFIIQTDNDHVPVLLERPIASHHKRKKEREAIRKAYNDVIAKHNIRCRFKHVKGHNGTKDKRSAVNTWCDKVCSFFLAMARHEAMPERYGPVNVSNAPHGVKIDA